jgi:hypothetical protein
MDLPVDLIVLGYEYVRAPGDLESSVVQRSFATIAARPALNT